MRNAEKAQANRVCDVCGVVGFAEEIVTCYRCNRNTEHIYCMKRQLDGVPKDWSCEGCQDRTPSKSTKRKTIQISFVDVQKKRSQVKRSTSWTSRGCRGRTNGNERRLTAPCSPSSMRNVISKIPDSEAASLSGAKRAFNMEQSLASELVQRNQAKLLDSPIIQTSSTKMLTVESSKSYKGPNSSEDKITSDKVQVAPVALATEIATLNGEGCFQNDVSGKEISGWICKKESLDLHQTSVPNTMLGESKYSFPASLSANDKQIKGVMLEALAPIKREPFEWCCSTQVQDSPSNIVRFTNSKCGADAMLFHAHELETNLETKSSVGKNNLNHLLDTKGCGTLHGVTSGNIAPADSSGYPVSSVSQCTNSGFLKRERPFTLLIISADKNLAPQPCWKGDFEVHDRGYHIYHGIQAHLASKISLKAYECCKRFPKKLVFKLLHRLEVWPELFRLDPPEIEDIGVYFFPCEQQRSKERYYHLSEVMSSCDFAMQGCLGDVELLLFTSKHLQSTGIAMEMFIWGIFRPLKIGKKCLYKHPGPIHAANNSAHIQPDNFVKIKPDLDFSGGTVRGGLGTPAAILDGPPGFSERKPRNIHSRMRPSAENACWNAASSSISDIPPGFSSPFTPKSGSAEVNMSPTLSRRDRQWPQSSVSRGGYATDAGQPNHPRAAKPSQHQGRTS